MIELHDGGVRWTPICACGYRMKTVWIDRQAPLGVPNQCPRCLTVLDLGELAERLLQLSAAEGM